MFCLQYVNFIIVHELHRTRMKRTFVGYIHYWQLPMQPSSATQEERARASQEPNPEMLSLVLAVMDSRPLLSSRSFLLESGSEFRMRIQWDKLEGGVEEEISKDRKQRRQPGECHWGSWAQPEAGMQITGVDGKMEKASPWKLGRIWCLLTQFPKLFNHDDLTICMAQTNPSSMRWQKYYWIYYNF